MVVLPFVAEMYTAPPPSPPPSRASAPGSSLFSTMPGRLVPPAAPGGPGEGAGRGGDHLGKATHAPNRTDTPQPTPGRRRGRRPCRPLLPVDSVARPYADSGLGALTVACTTLGR